MVRAVGHHRPQVSAARDTASSAKRGLHFALLDSQRISSHQLAERASCDPYGSSVNPRINGVARLLGVALHLYGDRLRANLNEAQHRDQTESAGHVPKY